MQIEAHKRISFEDLPPVLILYLKCFVYDTKSAGIQKLFKRVDYQIDLEINKSIENISTIIIIIVIIHSRCPFQRPHIAYATETQRQRKKTCI